MTYAKLQVGGTVESKSNERRVITTKYTKMFTKLTEAMDYQVKVLSDIGTKTLQSAHIRPWCIGFDQESADSYEVTVVMQEIIE